MLYQYVFLAYFGPYVILLCLVQAILSAVVYWLRQFHLLISTNYVFSVAGVIHLALLTTWNNQEFLAI